METKYQSSNKRIAKNTVYMYFRMLFIMSVGLYASRVILKVLGVEDYGIYNVVGGIVVILGFINGAMTAATQRFLNFELGKGNTEELRKVFATSLAIHLFISIVFVFFAETIGLWFLNSKMIIPEDRIIAANWVYQFSVFACIVNFASVPYNAAIIAHEKMSAFAYIGILESLLKLSVPFFVQILPFDKLIVFSILQFSVIAVLISIYQFYSRRHFAETRISKWTIYSEKFREMLSFSAWSIVGSLSSILHTQGIGIVINLFFGVTVNAAQGVANQVNGVVKHFIQNFTVALNPQIVKNYASGRLEDMYILLMRGCRIAYCMVSIFAVPIIIECPMILGLWLEKVPEYSVIFIRIIMLITLLDSFCSPLATAKNATGNIKIYQLVLTTLGLAHIPLAWLFFHFGKGPEYAMYVYLFLVVCMQAARIYMVCTSIGLSIIRFSRIVLYRCFFVSLFSFVFPLIAYHMLDTSVLSAVLVIPICFISTILATIYIGFDKVERNSIFKLIQKKINHS